MVDPGSLVGVLGLGGNGSKWEDVFRLWKWWSCEVIKCRCGGVEVCSRVGDEAQGCAVELALLRMVAYGIGLSALRVGGRDIDQAPDPCSDLSGGGRRKQSRELLERAV